MARRAGFAHNGGMDSVLIHNRKMGPRDWAVDVAVALAAFAFGAVQLMVSASLILPDEALRRMLGIEAVVPATSSFIALALTTFPLVARSLNRQIRQLAPANIFGILIRAFFCAILPENSKYSGTKCITVCRVSSLVWHSRIEFMGSSWRARKKNLASLDCNYTCQRDSIRNVFGSLRFLLM